GIGTYNLRRQAVTGLPCDRRDEDSVLEPAYPRKGVEQSACIDRRAAEDARNEGEQADTDHAATLPKWPNTKELRRLNSRRNASAAGARDRASASGPIVWFFGGDQVPRDDQVSKSRRSQATVNAPSKERGENPRSARAFGESRGFGALSRSSWSGYKGSGKSRAACDRPAMIVPGTPITRPPLSAVAEQRSASWRTLRHSPAKVYVLPAASVES